MTSRRTEKDGIAGTIMPCPSSMSCGPEPADSTTGTCGGRKWSAFCTTYSGGDWDSFLLRMDIDGPWIYEDSTANATSTGDPLQINVTMKDNVELKMFVEALEAQPWWLDEVIALVRGES